MPPSSSSKPDIRKTLETLAAAAGISLVGIAAPDPLEADARTLDEWLDAGCHADMTWMSHQREDRCYPDRFFPGTRSIAVFAFPYRFSGYSPGTQRRISRYAQGADYHRVVRDKLGHILLALQERFPTVSGRITVDTAPVFERTLAVRAGLGWIGKNGCLINRRWGSYVFLGEIFLDVALPPSQPAEGTCGRCRRCLDACPTGALTAPGRLDARRCIAYLTVEHRQVIPRRWKGRLGGWLFGCDICQEICPFNCKPIPDGILDLAPDSRLLTLDPDELLSLSGKAFQRRYGFSSLTRCGLKGLLRNLAALAPETDGFQPDPNRWSAARQRYPLVAAQEDEFKE